MNKVQHCLENNHLFSLLLQLKAFQIKQVIDCYSDFFIFLAQYSFLFEESQNPVNSCTEETPYLYTEYDFREIPVKYVDPDGKCANVVIGAVIGFATSSATEIGSRMASGQSFGEAVKNTYTDLSSLAIIGTSTLIGAATSGVSGMAVNATVKSVTTAATMGMKTGVQAIGEIAVKTVAINTVAGAVDAGAKDIVAHTIKGESESFGELAATMGKGALSAALFSGVTQGVIAAGSTATGQVGNVLTGTMKEFNINQPEWSGSLGVTGESIIPTLIDIKNGFNGEN